MRLYRGDFSSSRACCHIGIPPFGLARYNNSDLLYCFSYRREDASPEMSWLSNATQIALPLYHLVAWSRCPRVTERSPSPFLSPPSTNCLLFSLFSFPPFFVCLSSRPSSVKSNCETVPPLFLYGPRLVAHVFLARVEYLYVPGFLSLDVSGCPFCVTALEFVPQCHSFSQKTFSFSSQPLFFIPLL